MGCATTTTPLPASNMADCQLCRRHWRIPPLEDARAVRFTRPPVIALSAKTIPLPLGRDLESHIRSLRVRCYALGSVSPTTALPRRQRERPARLPPTTSALPPLESRR